MHPRRPRVFISANSTEFKYYRRVATEELLRMECDPISMDHFSTSTGNLSELLKSKISDCDAVLCLIGRASGERLPTLSQGRARSYTQYEFDLAQKFGKPTFLFVKNYGSDSQPLEDPLQTVFLDEIKMSGLVRHSFANEDEFRRHILGINPTTLTSRRVGSPPSLAKPKSPLALFGALALLLVLGGTLLSIFRPSNSSTHSAETQNNQPTPPQPTEIASTIAAPQKLTPPTVTTPPLSLDYEPGKPAKIMLAEGVYKEFAWCPPGSFTMGFSTDEAGSKAEDREDAPPQPVVFEQGYWIAKHELTYDEVNAFVGKDGFQFPACSPVPNSAERIPLSGISCDDAILLTEWLTRQQQGRLKISLPLECEWEYAARAGTTTPYSFGFELDGTQANCDGRKAQYSAINARLPPGKSLNQAAPIGSYSPNPWGIYDMHGNVREWTLDYHFRGYSIQIAGQLPSGPASGTYRVLRGGYWNSVARNCRSGARDRGIPSQPVEGAGIRLVARLKVP